MHGVASNQSVWAEERGGEEGRGGGGVCGGEGGGGREGGRGLVEVVVQTIELCACLTGFVFLFLETIRTGTMRVIHITVKTQETQRLRIKFALYCPT